MVSSGNFVVPVNETVEITEEEFKMLGSFFKLERVEEAKEAEPEPKPEPKPEPVKEPVSAEKPKKKAKK